MNLEPNVIISERYEIIEKIGVGGMSNVYRAKDLKLERDVTFKVLKEEFITDQEFINRFTIEARAVAKLSHMNIANVLDVGNDDNVYYIVMEYIDGCTLKELIKRKAPFTNEEALGVSIQIASALEASHLSGIIHRDIKPQNILITKDGTVKVTDFGIARAANTTTISAEAIGSVHYFSPEQARGSYVDGKSDIYSLGIVFYEMITGKVPFDGDGVVQLAMKHINEPLPNIRDINPEASISVEKIIEKCTEKSSIKRYESMDALNNDLKMALTYNDGSFMTNIKAVEESPTVVMSKEDLEKIRERTENLNKKKKQEVSKSDLHKMEHHIEEEFDIFEDDEDTFGEGRDVIQSRKRKDKKVVGIAVLSALLVMIIITCLSGFFIFKRVNASVEVPNFVGKTWEDAVEVASKNKIYIANTGEEFNDEVPENFISSQIVRPSSHVRIGDTINVKISKGTDKFELEDFVGKDISEVYTSLQDKNINLREEYLYDNEIEIGRVIKQKPSGGTFVDGDTDIVIYVSRGNEVSLVEVPNLVGLSEASAKAILSNSGLSIGDIGRESSNEVASGKVIRQVIPENSGVAGKTKISFVVSTGKAKVEETETITKKPEIVEPIIENTSEDLSQVVTEPSLETTTIESNGAIKRDTLVISPNLNGVSDIVELKVVAINSQGSVVIYQNTHNTSEFPVTINVSGNEPTEYQLYVNGNLVGTETKKFN